MLVPKCVFAKLKISQVIIFVVLSSSCKLFLHSFSFFFEISHIAALFVKCEQFQKVYKAQVSFIRQLSYFTKIILFLKSDL